MAAVDPYSYAPSDQQFTASNWKEDARNFSPNSAALFGPNGGEYSLVGNVDFKRTPAALRFFLGYSSVYPVYPVAGPYALKRTPPVYHPMFPRLVCVSAAAEPFRANPSGTVGAKTIKVTQFTLPVQPDVPASYDTIDGTSLGYMTNYQKSKITARFAPVPYRMLPDSDAPYGEWLRWCYIDQEPRSEVLSLSGFQSIYYEGSGFPSPPTIFTPTSNPSGTAYQSDVGTVITKSDLQVNWLNVPSAWIFTIGVDGVVTQFPRNILLGLGTVNSVNWNGYLAGTLLLSGVKFIRRPWPLAAGGEDRFMWDLQFQMTYFDPEKGYSYIASVITQLNRVDGAGEPTDPRGHNCSIYRGSMISGDINAGLWFGASYNGSSTGQGLFRKTDFAKLFASANNPY